MKESVMVVSGAFATHTTKLYNYYVCPINRNFKNIGYLAVNYDKELYYLGKIINEPIICNYEGDKIISEIKLDHKINIDLNEFKCKLNKGNFQLILLEPIIGGCNHLNLTYKGRGAFVSNFDKYKLFGTLADFFESHQRIA